MDKKAITVFFQEITQTAYLVHIEYMLSIEFLIFIDTHFLQGYKALKQHQKLLIIRYLYQFPIVIFSCKSSSFLSCFINDSIQCPSLRLKVVLLSILFLIIDLYIVVINLSDIVFDLDKSLILNTSIKQCKFFIPCRF